MKLYMANCSKNFAVLNYRILEIKNPMSQNVESGTQVLVAHPNLNTPQIDYLFEQFRTYGMFLVEELGHVPANKIIYWLGSLEKPVQQAHMQEAFKHNALALFNQGLDFRKAAAVAVNNNIAQRTPHAAGTLEITIQEESETNSSPTGEPLVAEGYRMAPTMSPDPFAPVSNR